MTTALADSAAALKMPEGTPIADLVKAQLKRDYPAGALGWLTSLAWSGPVRVPLTQIDRTAGKPEWDAAAADKAKQQLFRKKIASGFRKPVVLVRPAGGGRLFAVDGHSRITASGSLGMPVSAYIGTAATVHGPWESAHSRQLANEPGNVIELVGPKGYIHGWIHVGSPAPGGRVFHAGLGNGTVTSHDGGHVKVKFDDGTERTFEHGHGNGPSRLEKHAPAKPAAKAGSRDLKAEQDARIRAATRERMTAEKAVTARHIAIAEHRPAAAEPKAIVPRPEKVRELRKYPVSALREALGRPADKIGPQYRSEIQAALDSKTSRPATAKAVLSGKVAALQPKTWTPALHAKTRDALVKADPKNGATLGVVLDYFQNDGGHVVIPRLRKQIEAEASGGNKSGRSRQAGVLMDAIRNSDVSGRKLYRGMMIPGSAEQVAEQYKPGSSIHMSLGSFSSSRGIANSFTKFSAGQKVRGKATTPVVLNWEDGDKKALPLQNLARTQGYAQEFEYLSSGEFEIKTARMSGGKLVLTVRQVKAL